MFEFIGYAFLALLGVVLFLVFMVIVLPKAVQGVMPFEDRIGDVNLNLKFEDYSYNDVDELEDYDDPEWEMEDTFLEDSK